METDFDRFWLAFPRKQKKKDAAVAWHELHADASLVEQIIDALAWQRRQPQWLRDGGQYIPLPASWLRGERWTDEPIETTPSDPWNQRARTEEMQRLMAGGMSAADANRQVFK